MPKELHIGGHVYKVVLTDDSEILEGEVACMSDHELTIWIDKDAPRSVQESSLIHEIFHALNSKFDSTEIGHMFLESLAEQFYQVIKDNKLFYGK